MRKTIIFSAIAALLGFVAVAQASDNYAERAMRNGGQTTYADADDRHEAAEHKMRGRAEYRDRDDDANEHREEAHEREHRSGAYEDRD